MEIFVPNDNDWITNRITQALAVHHPSSTSIASSMDRLFRGQLIQKQLSKLELTIIAKELIKDLISPSKMSAVKL